MAARKTTTKAKAPPKRNGRPPHQPTDENRTLVSELAGVGCTHEYIARRLKMSADTLVKFYGDELSMAKEHSLQKVARRLYAEAENGNMTAAIFIMKTQGRWAEAKDKGGDDNPDAAQPVKVVLQVVDASVPRA